MSRPWQRLSGAWPLALVVQLGCAEAASGEPSGIDSDGATQILGPEAGVDAGAETEGAAITQATSCTGKTGAKGLQTLTVSTPDGPRSAALHVPEQYDPEHGTMLVFNLHALGSSGALQSTLSGMDQVADTRGFLVVYPEGLEHDARPGVLAFNAGICCNARDDLAFVRALLARLHADYCIDPARVYATGMSMGAVFTYRLACELSDVFAAVAPVSGGMLIRPLSDCRPTRPVPVLHIHGTADMAIPYLGGPDGAGHTFDWPPVEEEIALWRRLDACADPAEVVYEQGDASCLEWAGCRGQSHVQLCTIQGGGHSWPGSPVAQLLPAALGYTSADLNASERVIDFFERHAMP